MYENKRFIIGLFIFSLTLWNPLSAQNGSSLGERLQFDFQGESHFSRYNFTDINNPYNGIDGWAEFKTALWIDSDKSIAFYIDIIPSFTTESEFWWQKNAQFAAGLQWYPFSANNRYFRGIRLYSLAAFRHFFSEPDGVDQQDTDIQIGADYYFDNLFDKGILASAIWSNAGFRKTNFSFDDYNTFLWMGNIKTGIKIQDSKKILMGYFVLEWTYAPKYDERWWENFIRTGAGVRFYPWVKQGESFGSDFLRRFHVYAEFLYNAAWLGNSPLDGSVEKYDFRIGLGFSTGGFFREVK